MTKKVQKYLKFRQRYYRIGNLSGKELNEMWDLEDEIGKQGVDINFLLEKVFPYQFRSLYANK